MAPDEDDERWQRDKREREERYKAACEVTDRVHRGILTGNLDDAGVALGVPSADGGRARSRSGDEYQPTAAERFDFRRQKLIYDLNSTSALEDRLLGPWTDLVGKLDIARPEDGLAAVEWLWEDFLRATRHPPPLSDPSSRAPWEQQIPRLRDAIWQVMAIFDEVVRNGSSAFR